MRVETLGGCRRSRLREVRVQGVGDLGRFKFRGFGAKVQVTEVRGLRTCVASRKFRVRTLGILEWLRLGHRRLGIFVHLGLGALIITNTILVVPCDKYSYPKTLLKLLRPLSL